MMVLDTNDGCRNVNKVLIVGAGNGGHVAKNILEQMVDKYGWKGVYSFLGFADDDVSKPLAVCKICDIQKVIHDSNVFYIVSISSNQQVRRKCFEQLPRDRMINAVHPSAYVEKSAKIGVGNIIGANVYIGHKSVVGDNNLISSNSHIEHHNRIGSHNVFGPGVNTSGSVTIGDMCTFGAGVSIMPQLVIGDDVVIASNIPVWKNVNDKGGVKWPVEPRYVNHF